VDYGDGQTQSYTFDPMGNRLSRQDSASGTTNYSYNAANMLLSTGGYGASGFTNDADGNTLVGNGRTNAWDSQNRLVSCLIGGSTTAYKYGADGLRRQKTTNSVTTDYAYDSSMLVREGHASGGSLTASTVTAPYFQGVQGPCYRRDDTQTESDGQGHTFGKTRWYVYDGLGSVVGELDPLGDLTSSPKYDVYGATRSNGGVASSKQGFVGSLGHVSDDTGLIYMRARYYDPSVGRFASEDPSANGSNWFAYCDNNPVNAVDPTGKYSMYGTGAAIAWFLFLTYKFISGENTSDFNNDMKYAWGLAMTALVYNGGAAVSSTNNTARMVREIAKSLEASRNVPYAATVTTFAAGYALFLLFACDWCISSDSPEKKE